MVVYKPPIYLFSIFTLEEMTKSILLNYPTTIIGDFNIDAMIETSQSNALQNFKLTFKKITAIYNTQIYHIWTNAHTQQCHSTIT